MSLRYLAVFSTCVLFATTIAAQKVAERFQKRITVADENYKEAVLKAENAKFYAVQKASTDRVKVYRSVLADATKAGDFDQATKVKELLVAIENNTGVRERPKDLVKFKGHSYALIPQHLTWHLAVRYCEDMGGHLVCMADVDEEQFVAKLCQSSPEVVWVGATDEAEEGKWQWVTGDPVDATQPSRWLIDNGLSISHCLCYNLGKQAFEDEVGGFRCKFVCEWDK